MDDTKINEVLAKTQEREALAFDLFNQKFEKQFPAPETPNVRLMAAIGWQFIATIVQAIASVLLASLRTAQMFYAAAAGGNPFIQFLEAFAAILAVELGIVVFAVIKSEAKNVAKNVEDLNRSLDVSTRLLNIGIGAGVFVSIIAGLGVSFEGFDMDVAGFKWALALTMGIGASVIAWVSGDILGAILARYGNARLQATHEYKVAMTDRENQRNEMWEKAPERKIAVSELAELKAFLEQQRRERVPTTRSQAHSPAPEPLPQPIPRPKTSTRSNEVRNKVYEYLDRTLATEQRIAGPSELKRKLGVAKGYTGGDEGVIKQWMAERNLNGEAPADIPTPESVENETQ